MRHQRGFTLVSAVFLLVVLALLGALMVTISGTQHQSVVLGVESARALAAARSGVEWGAYQVLQPGNDCDDATDNFGLDEGVLSGFRVEVECVSSDHNESGDDISIYQITSIAERGQYGRPDYVRRRFQAQFVGGS